MRSYRWRLPVHTGTLSSSSSHGKTSAGGRGISTVCEKLATGRVRAADGTQGDDVGLAAVLLAAQRRHVALEVLDAAGHLLHGVGDRVGQVDPVGVRALGPAALDAHWVPR